MKEIIKTLCVLLLLFGTTVFYIKMIVSGSSFELLCVVNLLWLIFYEVSEIRRGLLTK